jgi:hypothetical protein
MRPNLFYAAIYKTDPARDDITNRDTITGGLHGVIDGYPTIGIRRNTSSTGLRTCPRLVAARRQQKLIREMICGPSALSLT